MKSKIYFLKTQKTLNWTEQLVSLTQLFMIISEYKRDNKRVVVVLYTRRRITNAITSPAVRRYHSGLKYIARTRVLELCCI